MRTTWPVVSVVAISLLQVLGVVLGGPLLLGLMRKVRCRLEGRIGPPIRQPLLDLRKLARRERTRPDQASWIFPLAPLVLVATPLVIAVIDRAVLLTDKERRTNQRLWKFWDERVDAMEAVKS